MQSVARYKIKTAKRKLDDSSSSLSAEMWSKKRAAVKAANLLFAVQVKSVENASCHTFDKASVKK